MNRCGKCSEGVRPGCVCHKGCQKKCHCHERKCHCNQNIKLLKDCVCVEWSVPPGRTQTVFQTGRFRRIFASGFVSFDCRDSNLVGDSDSVIVRFFLGSDQIGPSIRVFEESSVAFNYTRFDRITVECPATNVVSPDVCEGEICIKTRTPVY